MHPHTGGGAQFNTPLLAAMRERGPVEAISWKRLYPPILERRVIQGRSSIDVESQSIQAQQARELLDWPNPISWERTLRQIERSGSRAMILPWMHPVMAPPYLYLLARRGPSLRAVIICHNVMPHEMFRGARQLSRAVFSRADLLVTHAPQQPGELEALGVRHVRRVDTVHPRFPCEAFAPPATAEEVAEERARQGSPDLLLLIFGAIRPYKGVDIALEAVARLDRSRSIRLVIAGHCWNGGAPLREQIARLGLGDRVEVRDRFVPHEEAALLFCSADACVLPYRAATQSGVVQLSFSYGTPVVATRVGGLPYAIEDGVDGLLCPPEDPDAITRAIERVAAEKDTLAGGVRSNDWKYSVTRYVDRINEAVAQLQ
ncbi:MAG TPA: glycosyltransferase family 4 protein [Solirubrobacteraceae bacterium]|nr:glycosyltransferase family 4 protein [Solirubrobacteraceae bacterium]